MRRKSQSTFEYVVILAIAIGAIIAASGFFQGAIQAALQRTADRIGSDAAAAAGGG